MHKYHSLIVVLAMFGCSNATDSAEFDGDPEAVGAELDLELGPFDFELWCVEFGECINWFANGNIQVVLKNSYIGGEGSSGVSISNLGSSPRRVVATFNTACDNGELPQQRSGDWIIENGPGKSVVLFNSCHRISYSEIHGEIH